MRLNWIIGLVLLGGTAVLGWLAWQWLSTPTAVYEPAPTLAPTALAEQPATNPTDARPTTTLPPTNTPIPTATHRPIPTASFTPPPTTIPTASPPPTALSSTRTPSPTPAPTLAYEDTADRTCPNPDPLKPAYDRYYLSRSRWPVPDPTITTPHFWLGHPFPGGDRLLTNHTFPYGWDMNGRLLLHNGIDSAEPLGTPLLAVADGTIVVAQSDEQTWHGWRCNWYGHLVVLMLDRQWQDKPIFILYGHILNINVEVGQRVQQGEQLAEVGFGGAAVAPHLHLEIRVGTNEFGSTRNPMLWFHPSPRRGLVVGRLVGPGGQPWQGVNIDLLPTNGDASDMRRTWSYLGDPDSLINPDEAYGENFVFADVRPGTYELLVTLQGFEYKSEVTVVGGEVTTVEIITQPLQDTEPETTSEPEATPESEATPEPTE
ncbi:MAG: peptidoglycan DD-metalloendopeptidase family protein [Chloroflexota bacterium]